MELALNLFFAGFIIVFAVLILLILIVKGYSILVQRITDSAKKRKEKKQAIQTVDLPPTPVVEKIEATEDENGISEEIVAVIAAAVDYIYGEKSHKIKSVKRTKSARSAWAAAGLRENTRPF